MPKKRWQNKPFRDLLKDYETSENKKERELSEDENNSRKTE